MKDQLRLHNKSEHRQFAYRVLVSAASMFVLKKSEGVLEPTQKLSVPVVLKNFPASGVSDDEPLAKFAVEFLECDENYYLIGAKAFWKMNEGSQHCKKVISRGISKTRLSDLQKLPISETTLVSPSILYFNGKPDTLLYYATIKVQL